MMGKAKYVTLLMGIILMGCGADANLAEPETAVVESEPTRAEATIEVVEPTLVPTAEPTIVTEEEVAEVVEPTAEPTVAVVEEVENGRRFVIVPEESTASYSVGEEFFAQAVDRLGVDLGETVTIGSTQEIEGELVLDLTQDFPLLENHFTVNIQSLRSDQPRRDERLREQGLNSNRFPLAEFAATAIEGFPADYSEGDDVSFDLIGEMTIREVTNPATLIVTATMSEGRIVGTAVTTILMTDYGFDPPSIGGFFTVEDEVLLTIAFVAEES